MSRPPQEALPRVQSALKKVEGFLSMHDASQL
ncbi:hypothetical protein QFZ68_007357 [Streptomyces sp. V1I6]|nr:hypothetical protein [Streptomyces sp. V1I6]